MAKGSSQGALQRKAPATRASGRPRGTTGAAAIVAPRIGAVNSSAEETAASGDADIGRKRGRPGRKKTRRQQHGSAWHWRQTDCWYYTLPGTRKRVPLVDEEGRRIRGIENRKEAQLALARVKLAGDWHPMSPTPPRPEEVLVAGVCSEYLQHCERSVAAGSMGPGHRENSIWILNEFCRFCGALPVAQLKKAHVRTWIEGHPNWRSPNTVRSIVAVLQAAFNHATENHDVPNPIKGLKRPAGRPKLHSLTDEDERVLLAATDEPFRDFLFAALHTGLRPFCELARMTADDVEETPRGTMWRVWSSKTKKTRKIPVRPEVADLTRRLVERSPKGSGQPLFRNAKGTAWTKVAGVTRFVGLRRKLGWDRDPVRRRYSCYSCRHTFAHRMLSGYWNGGTGCSVETLAELIGDTPKVAFDHYGREWGQHFQDPLWNAIGVGK